MTPVGFREDYPPIDGSKPDWARGTSYGKAYHGPYDPVMNGEEELLSGDIASLQAESIDAGAEAEMLQQMEQERVERLQSEESLSAEIDAEMKSRGLNTPEEMKKILKDEILAFDAKGHRRDNDHIGKLIRLSDDPLAVQQYLVDNGLSVGGDGPDGKFLGTSVRSLRKLLSPQLATKIFGGETLAVTQTTFTLSSGEDASNIATYIERASTRTGISSEAIAIALLAENGGPNINLNAKNGSFIGPGQFNKTSWDAVGFDKGSALNKLATEKGYIKGKTIIDEDGFYGLRNNLEASIDAVADYGRMNLKTMKKLGVVIPTDNMELARHIYFAHHEGAGGAASIFKSGKIVVYEDTQPTPYDRLVAQDRKRADQYMAASKNDGHKAYISWLNDLFNKQVKRK